MATGPVDEERIVAGGDAAWALAEQSQRSAMWMTLLIVALMVPAIALQNVKLIVLGAIPIVLYAMVLAGRVLRPGGTLDKAWAASDLYLAPLGLQGEERPDVVFVPRLAGRGCSPRSSDRPCCAARATTARSRSSSMAGAARPTSRARHPRSGSRARASGWWPTATSRSRWRSRSRASEPRPAWTGMKLKAEPDGIVVGRRAASEQRWLYDLWLAERLADAVRA